MIFLNKYYGLIIVLALSIFSVLPFLNSGFFPMHDDTQVARVFEMGKALKEGTFPVRWVPDLGYGYGYPIFNFYAPLSYYFGGIFNLIGFNALLATKIMMVIGIIASGVFMYLFTRVFWGELGGAVSGLFYLFLPYHAVQVYVRGDVAEFWAYAFIPLIFYSYWEIYKNRKIYDIIIGSLSFAALILSHNLTAMMVTPFLLIFIIILSIFSFRGKTKLTIYYLFSAFFLGIGISAFYWLPALFEMRYTNILSQVGGGANFRDHFICLQELWDSPWGFGGSAPGCVDGMSFKIGKLHVIFSVVSIILSIWLFKKEKTKFYAIVFGFVALSICIFLTLFYSRPVWELIKPMEFFQYPWRFLILISFFSSFIAGSVIFSVSYLFKKQNGIINSGFAFIVIICLVFLSVKYFAAQKIINKASSDYTNEKELTWNTSKISDEYLPQNFAKPESAEDVASTKFITRTGTLGLVDLAETTQKISAFVETSENTNLLINIAYFPSWKVYLDGKEVNYNKTDRGIEIFLPKGFYQLDLKFEKTRIQLIAEIISIASMLVLVTGIIFARKRFSL